MENNNTSLTLKDNQETVLTVNDYKKIIEEILVEINNAKISDLKSMFKQAMTAQGNEPDMNVFNPINTNYIDLFIRQITSAIKMFDYDTLKDFHEYIVKLHKHN